METPTLTPNIEHQSKNPDFEPGATVIYGFHGKCNVAAIENREMAGKTIRFYRLEIQKSALSRSTRQEPAIWVPIDSAKERGLRAPVTRENAEVVMSVLASREYYFETNTAWSAIQPKLEAAIRSEGAIGLAKVTSYLYVLKRKQVVPSSDLVKMYETVTKLLLRELSEALGEPIRDLESRIAKNLRHKLIPDN